MLCNAAVAAAAASAAASAAAAAVGVAAFQTRVPASRSPLPPAPLTQSPSVRLCVPACRHFAKQLGLDDGDLDHNHVHDDTMMRRVLAFAVMSRCTLEAVVTTILSLFYVGLPFSHTLAMLAVPLYMAAWCVLKITGAPFLEFIAFDYERGAFVYLIIYLLLIWLALVVGSVTLWRDRREAWQSLQSVDERNQQLREANRKLLASADELTEKNDVLRKDNSSISDKLQAGHVSRAAKAAELAWRAAPTYSTTEAEVFRRIFGENNQRLVSWRVPAARIHVTETVASNRHSEVFKARISGVGEVCMKRMHNLHLGEDMASELLHEILLLSQLRHPNVVQFLGACLEPPHFGLLTEWMDLGSLWHLLHHPSHPFASGDDGVSGRPPQWERTKRRMAADAARGMVYLHAWQPALVHRDLKTLNLLVDERMRVKVADFGQSKFHGGERVTGARLEAGTPAYLAPEAISGMGSSELVDVYAFGVILWEVRHVPLLALDVDALRLACLRPSRAPLVPLSCPSACAAQLFVEKVPYAEENTATVLFQVVSQERRPSLEGACTPSGERLQPVLTELITTCWSANPHWRPSFRSVLQVLERVANGTADTEQGAGPAPLGAPSGAPTGAPTDAQASQLERGASQPLAAGRKPAAGKARDKLLRGSFGPVVVGLESASSDRL